VRVINAQEAIMRGKQEKQITMLSTLTPDQLVPQDHPIRQIKPIVDKALKELSPTFNRMYADLGRPSIPPEHLLKASLLIALYSIRSERQFCERLQYDLLFKWFLDLHIMDPAFDASSFSKNKGRLLEHQVAREFLTAVISEARRRKLLSGDHFTVDGTLLEAWASMKSIHPKDGGEPPQPGNRNPDVNFHGETRTNDTHHSSTDPEARLARKEAGKEAKLCFAGHVLMENRTGLVVDVMVTRASGTAERDTALDMIEKTVPGSRRITVGADKGYDTKDFVTACREMNVTPHVARRPSSMMGHP
jgi:transposase